MKKKAIKKKARKAPARKRAKRTAKKKPARKKSNRGGPGCRRRNKPKGVLIGDNALSITYEGGQGKTQGSVWEHEFETPVQVLGNKDGSITLRSKRGLSLWDYYDFEG